MALAKKFDFGEVQERMRGFWEDNGIYRFAPEEGQPVFSIDTPPPTVSGRLHLGHMYSYSHADFIARFQRMRGQAVFYPMGFDDNGLPTEQLVERTLGIKAREMEREDFTAACLEVGEQAGREYRDLWRELGLSVDWGNTYRTIGPRAQRISQRSFLDLLDKGLVYRGEAPVIWCPACGTAIAQAELEELERESVFYELGFAVGNGEELRIATTRPELLPACVAIFAHPGDARYQRLFGKRARVPLWDREVPILADERADPDKGTGAVMCCTFGDAVDVEWWRIHGLPLIRGIERDGRLSQVAGRFAGLTVREGRERIVAELRGRERLIGAQQVAQSVRVHERCDTPVEYMVAPQWFVRVLEFRDEWRRAGEQIEWYPPQMQSRYLQWVDSLNWDWCISRQRFFGVPFPVWHCAACGEIGRAQPEELPVDPRRKSPSTSCSCGSRSWLPEEDVMDTWATSSLTPQIAGGKADDLVANDRLFPMGMRAQAHDIIRTWAFYTIVKARHHWGEIPWKRVLLSGWGLAPEGYGKIGKTVKISKSRGGGPMSPEEVFARCPVDAVRYWAASTGTGKDALISQEKIQAGDKLITKLWNVARFSERFLDGYEAPGEIPVLSPADTWILDRLQALIQEATDGLERCDYAAAKSAIEAFFWRDLADNYLEMAKKRLYGDDAEMGKGALFALYTCLRDVVKLLAPFLPYVAEEIYGELFTCTEGMLSVHTSRWPSVDERLMDPKGEKIGELLMAVATAVRRHKSEAGIPLGRQLQRLQVVTGEADMSAEIEKARADIASVTRAESVEFGSVPDPSLKVLEAEAGIRVAVEI